MPKPLRESKKISCVRAKTRNQESYIQQIENNVITLCLGPSGVGKSHIAVGMAIKMLREGGVEKIIVTRPVVESGKGLGYLPGDVEEKVGPYLQPIFDEMAEFCEPAEIKKFKEDGRILIVPLEMMRGRTFKESFIILDEAQNATHAQMLMFLTRIGLDSKVVINGDSTQSDLPRSEQGAFEDFCARLHDISEVSVVRLYEEDVVRNPIIRKILKRMEV